MTDDATTQGDLAEAMLPAAAALVAAVHDGTRVEVGRVLNVIAPENLHALAVVLAAMADPDKSIADLLAWVTFDEHEHPVPDLSHQVAAAYGMTVPRGDPHTWSAGVLRACHAAITRHRDLPWVVLGEREYHRRRHVTKRGTQNANPG